MGGLYGIVVSMPTDDKAKGLRNLHPLSFDSPLADLIISAVVFSDNGSGIMSKILGDSGARRVEPIEYTPSLPEKGIWRSRLERNKTAQKWKSNKVLSNIIISILN